MGITLALVWPLIEALPVLLQGIGRSLLKRAQSLDVKRV